MTMNLPLVYGCILIFILATSQLTYQKSMRGNSQQEELTRHSQPRPTEEAVPENNHLVPPSPSPTGHASSDVVDPTYNYPTEKINGLLSNQSSSKLLGSHFYDEEDEHEMNRHAGPTGNPLCDSISQIVFPRKVKSDDGTYEFFVNNEEYKQGIRVEFCNSSANGRECNIPGSLTFGYKSQCVQKYTYRTLLVLKTNSSSFVTKRFKFPSHCSCEIFRELDQL